MIPAVQDSMRTLFKERMMIATHPSEVVAEGAAIQAQLRLNYKCKDCCLLLCSEDFTSCDPTVVNECGMFDGFATTDTCWERRTDTIGERSENGCDGWERSEANWYYYGGAESSYIVWLSGEINDRVELQETDNNKEIVVFVTANTIIGIVIVIRIIEKGKI